ncbi:predicted protein [Naegleria gruberi]|uniref:Fucosyltransferase n=1 Tax=Naegleria gruberi TaxID=5762 RepID=D2VYP5_NAEGR|nr:uncharacterized protein NAEGRDRAFT_81733 [Naegleria gruberi]EFC38095.1 predicted protein [Naegleria gruberi]|eukprot:XP_002670839.1 predicted protein [Naegleria gruberi strain NEG-M]
MLPTYSSERPNQHLRGRGNNVTSPSPSSSSSSSSSPLENNLSSASSSNFGARKSKCSGKKIGCLIIGLLLLIIALYWLFSVVSENVIIVTDDDADNAVATNFRNIAELDGNENTNIKSASEKDTKTSLKKDKKEEGDEKKEEIVPPPPIVKRKKNKQEKQQDLIFEEIAKLLTNPDQTSEGSYGWYRKQLDTNNRLGNTLFDDPIMTKLGFQDTLTTSELLFYYFRTFNTTQECRQQHTCKIYADRTAGEFLEEGTQLDAVVQHCQYKEPYFLNSHEQESKNLNVFHSLITKSDDNLKNIDKLEVSNVLAHSNHMDYLYGEQMWRGMRRLSIIMCSEARVHDLVGPITQKKNDYKSMQRFSDSTADISICFLSTCSVWVNYHYWQLSLSKSNEFGTKPFKNNKGICAFISNCDQAGCTDLKQRFELLNTLSKYIPVRQYGKCGKNAQEGPGGKTFEIENNCRFYYAAENSIAKDYVTEKFFEGVRALQNGARVITLYRGAPNLRQDWGFPKSLYLDHNDFESVDALGQYMKKLNDDDNAFERWFNKMTMQERKKVDKVLDGFEHRLGTNIPCRICAIVGEMKLARYLLFKIGLKTTTAKVNWYEWQQFKADKFENLSKDRLAILDHIYVMAFNIFQTENNKANRFNLAWDFNK